MRKFPVVLSLLSVAVLSGCGISTVPAGVSNPASGASIKGSVHGGQQPVGGATVQLMVPNLTQYGGTPTSIATTTTNTAGGFTLPGYTCPANSGNVYLLVKGGNSGSGTNTALGEAALLGPCSGLSSATFINVSEVTTVATAYALAPFAVVTAAATSIGAPLSNLQGLTNAIGPFNNLVNIQTGNARGPADISGLVLPQAELNTLADILASCVNTNGATTSTAACGMLFADATPAGGVAPVDTFQAALDIALNPANNASALYGLATASVPFQPVMTATPNDFAIGIQYTGGQITGSYGTDGVAIDSAGNAWIVTGNTANVHSLTEISPAGVYVSGTTGYGSTTLSSPQGIAIDATNNVYVTDANNNKVYKFASNGSLTSTFAPASLSVPLGIVIDTDNSLWVVDNGSTSVTHITAAGLEAAGSPFAAHTVGNDIALNSAGNWSADFVSGTGANGYLVNIPTGATASISYPLAGHGQGVAIDRNAYIWYTTDSSTGGTLGKINAAGVASFTPVATPGQFSPLEVFLDGADNVLLNTQNNNALNTPGALLEYSNAGVLISPASGITANATLPDSGDVPEGIAVDGSGNLWTTGYMLDANDNAQPNAVVTELVGFAAPVVTPIAVAAKNNALGTRP